MPNHYHLLLKPFKKDGLSRFMKKLNMGYAKYFNNKYERSGALFQGKYKSVQITDHAHFLHIPYYVHLNPLDTTTCGWRKGKTKDYKKAIKFLENYRWSSYMDYIGKKNFPSVTQRDFLNEFFEKPNKYKKETELWLKERDTEILRGVTLE